MALFKKVNRKRQTHIINDVAHIDWQWEAIQCGVYMDSDWEKKATDTTFCDPAEILVGFGQFSSNGVFRGYDFNPVVV